LLISTFRTLTLKAISWDPPSDQATYDTYKVYFAESSSGAGSQLIATVPVGTNQHEMQITTISSSLAHILVYTSNGNLQHSSPTAIILDDIALDGPPVEAVTITSWTDTDTEKGYISGVISFTPPSNWCYPAWTSCGIMVFLAHTAQGCGSQDVITALWMFQNGLPQNQIGAYSTSFTMLRSSLTMPGSLSDPCTGKRARYILVHLVNEYGKMSDTNLPAHAKIGIYDDGTTGAPDQNFGATSFVDSDMVAGSISGELNWTIPDNWDTTVVQKYQVYLADTSSGDNRQYLDEVAVGVNKAICMR